MWVTGVEDNDEEEKKVPPVVRQGSFRHKANVSKQVHNFGHELRSNL